MTQYTESGLKITINSDFSYKFDGNSYVKKFPLKKCDFFCKFLSKSKDKKIAVLIEAKEVCQNNRNNFTDKNTRESFLKTEILRKIMESYAFIKLFDFAKFQDNDLKESYHLLNRNREFVFILILNDFNNPLRPDQINSILETLRNLTANLKIRHLILSRHRASIENFIKIEPV